MQSKLNKIEGNMSKTFHWNVDKLIAYMPVLLVTLAKNRGKDSLVSEKVYKVLTHFPYFLFNSEIVLYKQVHFSLLNMHKVPIKAREEYHQLVMNNQ